MTSYSPFSRPFPEVETSDLVQLRSVAEGWYVEYKQLVPSASSIAKSVSGFANQFGGWLFYGIEEDADGTRTAGAFPGVMLAEVPGAEVRIREAVRMGMSPPAYFETRVLPGPCAEIGLSSERAIIVVRIPEGANTPYLHSSGRIYRRVADASDPREVTDRHTLDTLVERARERRRRLAETLATPLELSKGEDDTPYACLFFLPDPLGDRGTSISASFDEFADLMQESPVLGTPGLLFDNIFTSASGFIARQVVDNDPHTKVLTWHFRLDGSSIVSIPMRRGLPSDENTYVQQSQFTELCHPTQLSRVIDVNILLNVVGACVATHWRLCAAFSVPRQAWVKVRLENVWRLVPFLDTGDFISFVREFGSPTIQESALLVPARDGPEGLFSIDDESSDRPSAVMASAVKIASEVFYALGMPIGRVATNPEEFLQAGVRGGGVLAGRSRS